MSKKSVRYFKFQYLFGLACVAAGFSFNSCSKDTGIGANVLPQNSYFYANFSDTATIISSLVLEDTVVSNNLTTYLLGSYNDPIFGPTKASIYTQLSLPGQNPFPTSLTASQLASLELDSAVLYINYGSGTNGNYYGDASPQNVEVHLLSKGLKADTAYYSNVSIHYLSSILGSKNILPDFSADDSIRYGNYFYSAAALGPRWSIKLNHAWAQSWMDTGMNRFYTGSSTSPNTPDTMFSTNTLFQKYLPGLYITVNNPSQLPGQGGLWYMNPPGIGSQLLFYFRIKNGSSTGSDSLLQPTGFDLSQSLTTTVSHFDHDYKSSPFYKSPSGKGHDSVYSPNTTYLQSIGGVKVKLTVPYLKNWTNKAPIIVNKAELDIPIISYDFEGYTPPGQVYLIGINDTSTVASTATFELPDQYNFSVYGGTYDATNQQYSFVITNYIQEMIQGKVKNRDFYLVTGSAVDPSRVVMSGVAKTPNQPRIRLKIFYTPLKG